MTRQSFHRLFLRHVIVPTFKPFSCSCHAHLMCQRGLMELCPLCLHAPHRSWRWCLRRLRKCCWMCHTSLASWLSGSVPPTVSSSHGLTWQASSHRWVGRIGNSKGTHSNWRQASGPWCASFKRALKDCSKLAALDPTIGSQGCSAEADVAQIELTGRECRTHPGVLRQPTWQDSSRASHCTANKHV